MSLIAKALLKIAREEQELAAVASVTNGGTPSTDEPKPGDTIIMDGPLGTILHKALNISHAKVDPTSIAVESQANDAILAAQMRRIQAEGSGGAADQNEGTVLVYHGSVKDNTPEGDSAKDIFEDILKSCDSEVIDAARFVLYYDYTDTKTHRPGGNDVGAAYRVTELKPTKAMTNVGLGVESIQVIVRMKKK